MRDPAVMGAWGGWGGGGYRHTGQPLITVWAEGRGLLQVPDSNAISFKTFLSWSHQ